VTGTAFTPKKLMTRPMAVGGEVHCTETPLPESPVIQPSPRPATTDTASSASTTPVTIETAARQRRSGHTISTANGTTTTAVALTPIASPNSTPAASGHRIAASASPATRNPTITASLCAPDTRWIGTSGQASASHTARSTGTPARRASRGRQTAISATPSSAITRSTATVPASEWPSFAAKAASSRNTGP